MPFRADRVPGSIMRDSGGITRPFVRLGKTAAATARWRFDLIAQPRLSDQEPGLLEVLYINSALQPQHERWYVLCRPDPDWIMYAYWRLDACG